MPPQKNQWLLYIIGSIVFLSIPIINSDPGNGGIFDFNHMVKQDLLRFPLLLLFFYINYFYLIPRLYFTRKYFLYCFLLITAMFIIGSLPGMLFPDDHLHFPKNIPGLEKHAPPHSHNFFFSRINHNVFLFMAVALLSLLIRVRNRWKETEKEKLNTELLYLKAQINPHFLFNTLNSIYSLAIQKAEDTPEAVQKLAAMMRYVLTEANNNLVPLQLEIDYIRNYIDLQQLRFGNEVKLNCNISGDANGKRIAPLILISFIENAFKYGMNAAEDTNISILVNIQEERLEMLVTNNKVTVQVSEENRSGIGIGNTRSRLRLLYPYAHELHITEDEKQFNVKLSINL